MAEAQKHLFRFVAPYLDGLATPAPCCTHLHLLMNVTYMCVGAGPFVPETRRRDLIGGDMKADVWQARNDQN